MTATKTKIKTVEEPNGNLFYKFFNFKKIADEAKIQPDKLYNNFKGFYNSMQDGDKERVAGVLIPRVKELFKYLGYSITITKG